MYMYMYINIYIYIRQVPMALEFVHFNNGKM